MPWSKKYFLDPIYWFQNTNKLMHSGKAQLYRSNSSLSLACIKATMVLVTDVPIFDPMMMGMADLTSSTVMTIQQN